MSKDGLVTSALMPTSMLKEKAWELLLALPAASFIHGLPRVLWARAP